MYSNLKLQCLEIRMISLSAEVSWTFIRETINHTAGIVGPWELVLGGIRIPTKTSTASITISAYIMINPLKPGKKSYISSPKHPHNPNMPKQPSNLRLFVHSCFICQNSIAATVLLQGFNIVEHVHIKEDTLESEDGAAKDHPTIRCLHVFTCVYIYTHYDIHIYIHTYQFL